jgi:hypothetical protein
LDLTECPAHPYRVSDPSDNQSSPGRLLPRTNINIFYWPAADDREQGRGMGDRAHREHSPMAHLKGEPAGRRTVLGEGSHTACSVNHHLHFAELRLPRNH